MLPAALGGGIALQRVYPGRLRRPDACTTARPTATWIALYGSLAALVVGGVLVRRRAAAHAAGSSAPGPTAALAAVLFALPVAVHGFSHWTPEVSSDP